MKYPKIPKGIGDCEKCNAKDLRLFAGLINPQCKVCNDCRIDEMSVIHYRNKKNIPLDQPLRQRRRKGFYVGKSCDICDKPATRTIEKNILCLDCFKRLKILRKLQFVMIIPKG